MSVDSHQINQRSIEEQLNWYKKELEDKNLIINTILESTLAGYWDWQIQENTEYLSPTFKKMFGYEDHEMENAPESWQKIIHPDDLPEVFECFNAHVESKGDIPFDNTVRYYHKNGSIVNVYCKGHVVEWGKDGKPIRMIGAHIDITPLKKVQEQLSRQNTELEDFAYATSHDLKEPLRTVTSFIDIIQNEETSQEQKNHYMEIVNQSAQRMTKLIQGLLDHSRIGKELSHEKVAVHTILEDVCADLSHRIQKAEASINYPNDLPTIDAYPTELRILFQNLISNAIKFSNENQKPVVDIDYKEDQQYHTFTVSDNGIGIAENKHDKIFKLFTRLHSASSYEGTGIGLTHCKKIANLHKGHIHVSESSEKGTTFKVQIAKSL